MQLDTLRICIVGSAGQMGKMFKTLWAGKLQHTYDLALEPDKRTLSNEQIAAVVPNSDIVVFSVPISKLAGAVQSVAPYLQPNCIVTDLSSVKIIPMQIMEEHCPCQIVGAHPLFGPESINYVYNKDSLESQFIQKKISATEKKVAIVPGKNANEHSVALITALFESAGCETFLSSMETHDKAVAIIQGLNFISNLAYFSMASDFPEIDKFITPSFKRRLYASKTMLVEDAELFINIARHSPPLQEALQNYTNILEEAIQFEDKSIDDMLNLARRYFKP